jgi:hypothetical protein
MRKPTKNNLGDLLVQSLGEVLDSMRGKPRKTPSPAGRHFTFVGAE